MVVFCEGPTDARVASTLTTRVLAELAAWITREMIGYRGVEPGTSFTPWSKLAELAKLHPDAVPRRFGRGFRTEGPWGPEFVAAWNALSVAKHALQASDGQCGVLLLRDGDSTRAREELGCQRRAQIAEAVRAFGRLEGVEAAFGVADPKVEAWVCATFDPQASKVDEVRRSLGLAFNPVTDAHLLRGLGKSDAKGVLEALLEGAHSGSDDPWVNQLEQTPLEDLAPRGHRTGLRDFLCSVRGRLGGLVAPHIPECAWCDREPEDGMPRSR